MAIHNPVIFATNIEILTNALQPLFRAPTGWGGITLVDATVMFQTAGSASLYLVDAGTAGTSTTGGTLATYGGTAYTAKTPIAMSISSGTSAYLAEGRYLAVKEANNGTTVDITQVAIAYRHGK